jgi:hypothetical protein
MTTDPANRQASVARGYGKDNMGNVGWQLRHQTNAPAGSTKLGVSYGQ